MSTYNKCFRAEIKLMYSPIDPSFTLKKWDQNGSAANIYMCINEWKAEHCSLIIGHLIYESTDPKHIILDTHTVKVIYCKCSID